LIRIEIANRVVKESSFQIEQITDFEKGIIVDEEWSDTADATD
jgi:hypothetical protein